MAIASLPWSEMRALGSIALPLITAYLAEFLMFLTTKLIVGKLGYEELAAVGITNDLTFELMVILMGLLSVVGVLIAEAHGANQLENTGHTTRQGLLVATGLGLGASVLVWNLPSILQWLGQDPVVVQLSAPFAHYLTPFVLPLLWFSVLRSFVTALSSTGIIMAVTIIGVASNYVLSLVLVHGKFGIPALGLAGAGLSLSLVNWLMLILLVAYIYYHSSFQKYALFRLMPFYSYTTCRDILRLGIPVTGLVMLEASLFMAVSVLSGILGTDSLAACQIIMSWVAVPFVIGLGIGNATMVRVAFGIGQGNLAAARRSGIVGMVSGFCVIAVLVFVPLTLPGYFVSWFLRADDPGYAQVLTLVTQLLVIVAFFQLFDGLQVISSHALRGLRDTVVPLFLATTGYWLIGIVGGSLITFGLDWGVVGLWLGLASGLTVTGTLLARRFLVLTRRAASTG